MGKATVENERRIEVKLRDLLSSSSPLSEHSPATALSELLRCRKLGGVVTWKLSKIGKWVSDELATFNETRNKIYKDHGGKIHKEPVDSPEGAGAERAWWKFPGDHEEQAQEEVKASLEQVVTLPYVERLKFGELYKSGLEPGILMRLLWLADEPTVAELEALPILEEEEAEPESSGDAKAKR